MTTASSTWLWLDGQLGTSLCIAATANAPHHVDGQSFFYTGVLTVISAALGITASRARARGGTPE